MPEEIIKRIKEEANLYLKGLSLRQISKELGISHVTVHYDLTNRLVQVDSNLFELVSEKLESNIPKSIKDPEVLKRVLTAYKLLIYENKTINEIANELNVPFFVVYRDLSTRLISIHEIAPETVTSEMISLSKKVLSFHSSHSQKPFKELENLSILK